MVSCCMVPKQTLNVMDVEVDRVLKLTDKGIEGIGWKVPRRDKSKVRETEGIVGGEGGGEGTKGEKEAAETGGNMTRGN